MNAVVKQFTPQQLVVEGPTFPKVQVVSQCSALAIELQRGDAPRTAFAKRLSARYRSNHAVPKNEGFNSIHHADPGSENDTITAGSFVVVPQPTEPPVEDIDRPTPFPHVSFGQITAQDNTHAGSIISRRTSEQLEKQTNDTLVGGLEMIQNAIQHVLTIILLLNSSRAPAVKQIQISIQELAQDLGTLGTNARLQKEDIRIALESNELQQKMEALVEGPFAALQTDETKRAGLEEQAVQSLLRLEAFLSSLLDTASADWPPSDSLLPMTLDGEPRAVAGMQSANNSIPLSPAGHVNAVRERLADLRDEHARLLDEQKARAKLGLSMDEDSLQFLQSFEHAEQVLLDQLDHEEIRLHAVQQLLHDEEARQISNEALESERDENAFTAASANDAGSIHAGPESDGMDPTQSHLQKGIQSIQVRFGDFLLGEQVDTMAFVNMWLLNRLQHAPRLLSLYTSIAEEQLPAMNPEDMVRAFLDHWFNDLPSTQFVDNRDNADERSLLANLDESQDVELDSTSAQSLQLAAAPPLMKLGSEVTIQQVMDQAMKTKGVLSSHSSIV